MKFIKKNFLFLLLFGFFLLTYSILGVQKHNRFETGDDLTVLAQPIWHLSRFENPYSSILHNYIFNDHFEPILIAFTPFYWIWSDARVLILAQQTFVVLGVIPVYLYSLNLLKKRFIGLIFSFLYLYFIGIQSAISSDFHTATISATFISFTIYFLEIKKWRFYWFFVFLSLICREDVPLYIFGLGIYLFIIKKEYKRGLLTAILSIIYFSLIDSVFLPILNGYPLNFGSWTGGSAGVSYQIKKLILTPLNFVKLFFFPIIKLRNIILTSLSFGFLPFLSPLYWIVAPFTFLRHLLPDAIKYSLHFHYAASLSPILAFSAINSLKKFKNFYFIIGFLLLALIGTFYVNKPELDPGFPTPPISFVFKRSFYILPPRNDDYNKIMSLIPQDSSVSAQTCLLPHLGNREKIYRFPDQYQESDYIALTFTEGPYPLDFNQMNKLRDQLLADPNYEKLYLSYAGVLLKRKK